MMIRCHDLKAYEVETEMETEMEMEMETEMDFSCFVSNVW
jgi:hypothetical protein